MKSQTCGLKFLFIPFSLTYRQASPDVPLAFQRWCRDEFCCHSAPEQEMREVLALCPSRFCTSPITLPNTPANLPLLAPP
jgi:hypothetical protein